MPLPITGKLSESIRNSDLLELELYSNNSKKILLVVTESVSINGVKKDRLLTRELAVEAGTHHYILPLSSFDYPNWWLMKHDVSKAEIPSFDAKLITAIAFQNDVLMKSGLTDFYTLLSFKIRKFFPVTLFFIPVVLLIILELYVYTQKIKKFVTINFNPIEKGKQTSMDEWSLIQNYMAEHFPNSELKLDLIQKDTGIAKTKISELIKKKTGLSVKQYINQIRIHEATQHLKSDNFSISEVAYRVGFSNVSHFNRVFKELIGKNPSDYKVS